MKHTKPAPDISTEAKIKAAARKVFTTKGYAGARTRDIAEAAGMNLALLNYYFKSKEKLFQLIMFETVQQFVQSVTRILTNEETSLTEKTEAIATNYIDMLTANPDIPLFILSELRTHPDRLVEKMGIKSAFRKSAYLRQLKKEAKSQNINPVHYFINTMALIIFPFIGKPMIKKVVELSDREFTMLMQERKTLIVKWIGLMLKAK